MTGPLLDSPAELVAQARALDRDGRSAEAMAAFTSAIAEAERVNDAASLAEALRRISILHHRRGQAFEAIRACERSVEVAREAGLSLLAAEALNSLGAHYVARGAPQQAISALEQALELGSGDDELRARVELNLGILASIRGELDTALNHYVLALAAYQRAGNEHGCALTAHNLGKLSAGRGALEDAERHFLEAVRGAEGAKDLSLQALCLVSLADIDVARQRFEESRQRAETALAAYDRLGSKRGKADAYRVIGMFYRETGRHALAESRLSSAIDLAVAADATLIEAEACRELAILHRMTGRNRDALLQLNRAHRLFHRLHAHLDAVNVGGRVAELQGTYVSVVREWGQSIESRDSSTFGHCERVARHAVGLSRALGLDEHAETTILLGAYLHDVGMVCVPHEILGKTSALTPEELKVWQMHTVWGAELLANIEFPWEIKPVVRWHHERRDGAGYPDQLRGDEVPLSAQVVGILDAYDDLVTGRFGAAPVAPREAVWRIVEMRAAWSERVVDAFVKTIT
jgi:putative nucleotidyltransferase with HDIG domain